MATKYLGRTALEGGRVGYYKYLVEKEKRSIRASMRTFNKKSQEDGFADEVSTPLPRPIGKRGYQTDKLNAVWAYLVGRCGEPWDTVRSELVQQLNTDTLAGRHVLYDHVLKQVTPLTAHDVEYADFVVDSNGLLQEGPWRLRRRSTRQYLSGKNLTMGQGQWLVDHVRGKGVKRVGDVLYWASPVAWRPYYRWWRSKDTVCDLIVKVGERYQHVRYEVLDRQFFSLNWRQDRAFSAEETKLFWGMPLYTRETLLTLPTTVTKLLTL